MEEETADSVVYQQSDRPISYDNASSTPAMSRLFYHNQQQSFKKFKGNKIGPNSKKFRKIKDILS